LLSLAALLTPAPAALAAPEVCDIAAQEIEASLRAFNAAPDARPHDRISIANAAAKHPAAGLGFGAKFSEESLSDFPLPDGARANFKDSIRLVYQAGGPNGLLMLDAVQGTAYCHVPYLFTLASGSAEPLKVPEPGEPFERCSYGGVALGAAAGSPFYAQTYDDYVEKDELRLFPFKEGRLSEACTIAAHYGIVYQTAESFCKEHALCSDYGAKAAKWAADFRTRSGQIDDPSLTPAADGQAPKGTADLLPFFGQEESKLVPQPFRFDGSSAWFAIKGDPRADTIRIGAAAQGPAMMANWDSFTLVTLYKNGRPAGSLVVERRRGAFQSLSARESTASPDGR
jgi:hypothetical protein